MRRCSFHYFRVDCRPAPKLFTRAAPSVAKPPTATTRWGPWSPSPSSFRITFMWRKMGIDCLYCHTYARRSAVSGIPRLNKCIGLPPEHRVGQGQAAHQEAVRLLGEAGGHSLEEGPRPARFRALQSRAAHPAVHLRSGASHPRSLRLLPRRRGEHDHGAPGQGNFDGMVHQLSRKGPQDRRRQPGNQPWARRLLAVSQMSCAPMDGISGNFAAAGGIR